jgi:hypothetical protein
MNFEDSAQLLLGQSLALGLLFGVVHRSLDMGIQNFMRDIILKKPTGKLKQKK